MGQAEILTETSDNCEKYPGHFPYHIERIG